LYGWGVDVGEIAVGELVGVEYAGEEA